MNEAESVFHDVIREDSSPKSAILKRVPIRENLLDDTPYSMNVANLTEDRAYQIAREEFSKEGMNLDDEIPKFRVNFNTLRDKVNNSPGIPRKNMLVIEPEDIDEFQEDLQSGRVDIFQPYAFDSPVFPEDFPTPRGLSEEQWVELGTKDGDQNDDTVQAYLTDIPCAELRPTQGQIWYEKLIGNMTKFGVPNQGSPIFDKTIIVSEDGYILDGHHRFGQASLADPSLKMPVLNVPLNIDLLLEIARSYSKATGHEFKD